MKKRLIRGFGATALGPLITIVVQLISVPIFLAVWGARLYGEWLILSAIPTYLAFSDLGFGDVAASDMTMRVAAREFGDALETFQSAWMLITITSTLLYGLTILGVYSLPLAHWLHIFSITASETRLILAILSAYALLTMQSGLIVSGFRCEGKYAYGIFLSNVVRLTEALAATLTALCQAHPWQVAAAYLFARLFGTLAMSWIMRRSVPWIRYGRSDATLTCAKRLFFPAIAFMAFPVGNSLSIQGLILVIGVTLGPISVATFSTMRTMTRFAFQLMETVKNSVWPELSAAYGARDLLLARKLHRIACQAGLWMSIAGVAFLWLIGPTILMLWTHGKVPLDIGAFHWLLLVVIANSFWNTSSVVALASNTHQRLAMLYLAGTLGALASAYLLTRHMGLVGAALSLFVVDTALIWYVLQSSLSAVEDVFLTFAVFVFRIPNVRSIITSIASNSR